MKYNMAKMHFFILHFSGMTSTNYSEFLLWKTCLQHVFTHYQGCTAAYWQACGIELAHRHSDGKRSRMSFTFADADYIKTYIILPLYHMWAKHIPVACKCWGYCPSNLCTWDSSQSTCPTALLHGANVGLYQRMWLHRIDITKNRKRKRGGGAVVWKELKAGGI